MALTTLTARVDQKDKADFDKFCSNVGLNTSTAINLFVKAVLREKRIPFEIAQAPDPFFSEANIAYVKKSGLTTPGKTTFTGKLRIKKQSNE